MYISDVTGDDFVGQTAALASRFLLQGLRLPDINELNKTTGFYKFTGQQFPVARHAHYRLTSMVPARGLTQAGETIYRLI